MIALGAFDLHAPLGKGGMGEVWRGVHREQLVPVAVKLLTSDLARKASFRNAFRNEVEAVARLDHPNVVMVFDYGEVDAATSRASKSELMSGTPWLAMELVERGSLDRSPPQSWKQLRAVLLTLLDALAHAHARGVIHRDIKPGNVLVSPNGAVQLTDFGLAHAMDRGAGELVAGTPSYMAPEQFEGRWRDYGPWTDLYAVGCLGWALCAGQPPFGVLHSWADGMTAHREREVPEFVPRFAVPDELERWLLQLLAKTPEGRFARAADAAWSLLHLPTTTTEAGASRATFSSGSSGSRPASSPPRTPGGSLPTMESWDDATMGEPTTSPGPGGSGPGVGGAAFTLVSVMQELQGDSAVGDGAIPRAMRPPIPASWKRPVTSRRSARILGAGLGLFGLRTLPLVGRRAERDALWSLLRECAAMEQSAVVVLSGNAGCGRSRLAQWMCERAHEVGAATALSASATPQPGTTIAGMLERHLRCQGLRPLDRLGRVRDRLCSIGEYEPDIWERMTAALEPGLSPEKIEDRQLWLKSLAQERPLVVALDGAEQDDECLDLAVASLDIDAPLLLVIVLGERTIRAGGPVVSRILEHERTLHLPLGPLPEQHRAELVRHLLGLEASLAVEVEHRTGGNPRYAVELVGDWVKRGLLVPGKHGFRLKDAASTEVSTSNWSAWANRVERAVQGRSSRETMLLELMGVLGRPVPPEVFATLVDVVGLDVVGAGTVRDRWVAAGIMVENDDSLQFADAVLPDLLRARVKRAGRIKVAHARCAEILERHPGRGVHEQRARHLIAAGAGDRAIDALLAAADERLIAGESSVASALLSERERVLESAGVPVTAEAHAEGWVRWGQIAEAAGRLHDAEVWGERAERSARTARWGRVLVDALVLRGAVSRRRGDAATAWPRLFEAERLASSDPTRWRLGRSRVEIGRLLLQTRRLDRAGEVLKQARQDLEAAQDVAGQAEVLLELARVAAEEGHVSNAESNVAWAIERGEWMGCRVLVARGYLILAQIARRGGNRRMARRWAEDAIEHFSALGSTEAREAEVELALQALDGGDPDQAIELVQRAIQLWTVQEHRPAMRFVHLLVTASAAERGDVAAIEHHVARVEALSNRCPPLPLDGQRLVARVVDVVDPAMAERLRRCTGLLETELDNIRRSA